MTTDFPRVFPDLRWPDSRCIVCPHRGILTDEHILRQSVGGKLYVRFLCAECNNERFQSEEQRDKAWAMECRLAVEFLRVNRRLDPDPLPKWPRLDLKASCEALFPERLVVLTAYEYAACVGGARIYDPVWDSTRAWLMAASSSFPGRVERWITGKYDWMHGLSLDEAGSMAVVEVRLFRYIAYRVHFPVPGLEFPKRAYSLNLASRQHGFSEPQAESARRQSGCSGPAR